MTEIADAIKILEQAGFLVFKIPPCKREGRGHGRHTLITRSAMCPGSEPKPHGVQNVTMGTFGSWVHCYCGESFSDYGDQPTNWEKHKQEPAVAAAFQSRADRGETSRG